MALLLAVSWVIHPQHDAGGRLALDSTRTERSHVLEEVGERNQLLRLLSWEDRDWIRLHVERRDVRNGQVLAQPDQRFDYVYFPETCVISVVNPTDEGVVEVGTIGNEGMAGLSVFLGVDSFPNRTLVQLPGTLLRMPATVFADGTASRPALRQLLLRYTHTFLVQVAQTAACNQMHTVDQRCARWLLTAHDRIDGTDTFQLTHEFLALMLGVRRAGVTIAAGALQQAQLIRYARGKVTVLDRAGLERVSCDCYRMVRSHNERVLGTQPSGRRAVAV